MVEEMKVLDKYIVRKDLLYTKNHEWVKQDGDVYIYGISDYAQKELGDLAFVEFPEEEGQFTEGAEMGNIEALKTVASYYAPFDCVVVEINSPLEDEADIINRSPYDEGWIVKIKAEGSVNLMSPDEYAEFIKKEAH